jgi:UDP-N-acetyl-D-glucosamine dehydrogenase
MPAAGSAALNTPARFQSKIDSRTARIGVIGLGYVGLPLVLLFSGESSPSPALTLTPTTILLYYPRNNY